MGIFNRIFRNKTPTGAKIKLITERGNGFYLWNGNLYQSDVVRSCIRPKAKAIGKLMAKHIRKSTEGIKINPEPYMRFLLEEPNPLMSGQLFLEKITTQLALNNNAFAVIIRDNFGMPIQLYPVICSSAEAVYSKAGELYLKFYLKNGNIKEYPYSDIIHLRQDFNDNDVFGDSPAKVISSLMEIVNTTDQGIINAIKNSNLIRWLLKIDGVKRKEDIDKKRAEFVKDNLSVESNTGGVMVADGTFADVKQVDPKDYIPNASQMDRTTRRIYNFFNTNEKIVQSRYNEDEWNAYYESEIEPFALQMSNEFTRKLFTRKERGFGNKIIFESLNLQYASMSTKLKLLQMVDRGAMTPNEWREVLNMGPIEGGDKAIRRKDTGLVKEGDGTNNED